MMWNWNEFCASREMSCLTKRICISIESHAAMRGANAIYKHTHTQT